MKDKLSFFVIGAQKAGTTSIHNILSKHPKLCLPTIKETHFFSKNENYIKGNKWYYSWFDNMSDKILGEVDPEYLYYPEAAKRIKKNFTNPKFIVVLRHPMERAYSHYLMSVRRGYETLSFENAIINEQKRLKKGWFSKQNFSYLDRGNYYNQISNYKSIFPNSKFLFLKFDNLFNEKLNQTLFNFLEVDYIKINLIKENSSSEPKFTFLRDLIYKKNLFKTTLGKLPFTKKQKLNIALFFDKFNRKSIIKKNDINLNEVANKLGIKFNFDNLSNMTNLNFGDWRIE